MTWTLGTSRLTYDFFGTWNDRMKVHVEAPDFVLGDPSNPGSCRPGTFALCGGRFNMRLDITDNAG